MGILVNVDVNDLEKAVKFYRSALGFHLVRRLGRGFAELAGGSSRVYLIQAKSGSAPVPGKRLSGRDYARHWTPVHVDVTVTDIRQAVDRAVAAGAKLEGRIRHHSYGHLATLADPFGHGFCLILFIRRGYDALVEKKKPDQRRKATKRRPS